jgi:dTDP-4-amino-4,6-dideoxygalactose transaminase
MITTNNLTASPRGTIRTSDLTSQYRSIQGEIDEAVGRVLAGGEFERGEELWALDRELAAYLGVRHVVPVGSGYAALFLALRALGVGPGDEVITVANTDITTCSAITHCGARIVWADVDEQTFTIDPESVAERISPRTRAFIAVHLYGLPADLPRLMELSRQHDIPLVEDAALAFGAAIGHRRVGSIGHLGCFSFAPHKILGGYGDGGMVVTDDDDLAERVRLLAGYGEPWRESMAGPDGRLTFLVEGYHSHLDLLQAAVLRVKLRHVDEWITARRSRAALYDRLLAGSDAITPVVPPGLTHVYRNYVVRLPQRDTTRAALAARGIDTSLLYLPPLHLQPVYDSYGLGPGSLRVTERLAEELLCLPIYPELCDEAVQTVAASLLVALEDHSTKGAL